MGKVGEFFFGENFFRGRYLVVLFYFIFIFIFIPKAKGAGIRMGN